MYNTLFGFRSTADFPKDPVTGLPDARKMDYRDLILMLDPNGETTLTGLTSLMKKVKTVDPEFSWWVKMIPHPAGAITGIYTDPALANTPTSITAGDTLYIKTSEAVSRHFNKGTTALLRRDMANVTGDPNKYILQVDVLQTINNGVNSQVIVRALGTSADADQCNRIQRLGMARSEGAGYPDSISYDPIKMRNYTQIFVTPFDMTRTAMETALKYAPAGDYANQKNEHLIMHGREQERVYVNSMVAAEYVGDNGKPRRISMGLRGFIHQVYNDSTITADMKPTIADYRVDNPGVAWKDGGIKWLNEKMARILTYGGMNRVSFSSAGAKAGIQQLIESTGEFDFDHKTLDFGINITNWHILGGNIAIKTYPMLTLEPSDSHTMIIFDPTDIVYRYLHDTDFINDDLKKHLGHQWIDGIKEGWLTEAGLEFHFPVKCGILTSVGLDG